MTKFEIEVSFSLGGGFGSHLICLDWLDYKMQMTSGAVVFKVERKLDLKGLKLWPFSNFVPVTVYKFLRGAGYIITQPNHLWLESCQNDDEENCGHQAKEEY